MTLRYGSVCSGIEAATTAWHPLGWQPVFFSEIEPFPCAVLSHHWPAVPNLGDLTKHESWNHEPIDLLVGGTPCQAFSVAGLREGLADPRGNLTLTFLALVKRTQPRWVVWENVPGVLSDDTNAFGHFLSGLAELGYGWAYRVLDAQYFGVAQRRRRVFVVACAGGHFQRAAAVLFEPDCLRGHPPPRRETGEGPAGTISSRTTGGGGLGTDFDLAVGLQPVEQPYRVANTLTARMAKGINSTLDEGQTPIITRAKNIPAWVKCECCDEFWCNVHNCHTHECDCPEIDAWGDVDPYSAMPVVTHSLNGISEYNGKLPTLRAKGGDCAGGSEWLVTHSLRGEGFDASEDGTGRGTPLVPVIAGTMKSCANSVGWTNSAAHAAAGYMIPVCFDTTQITSPANYSNPQPGNPAHPVSAGAHAPCIAFPERMSGTQCARTDCLRAFDKSPFAVMHQWRVRRLTPRECERLQGFPDDHTRIPWRKKPAEECPDGPRYKAIGNSMAVPVMAWIGRRLATVDALFHSPSSISHLPSSIST